jgi:hypothetical protein
MSQKILNAINQMGTLVPFFFINIVTKKAKIMFKKNDIIHPVIIISSLNPSGTVK